MEALWTILGVIGYFLIGAVIAGIGLRTGILDKLYIDNDNSFVVITLWPGALIIGIVSLIVGVFERIALWIAKKN